MDETPDTIASSTSRFSTRARLRSFLYAARGIRWLVQDEHNARLHFGASIAVIASGIWLRIPAQGWRWLVLAIALVWITEALNTAIEEICDRICPTFDPAIGRIKDLAAGAVLIASAAAAAIGMLTLGPALLQRLF